MASDPDTPAPASEPATGNVGPAPRATDQAAPARAPAAVRPARAPAGELTSAVSALVLFVLMFAVKWFGVVALPRSADRSGIQSAASAWTELSVVRWVMLMSVAIAIGSVVLHVTQRSHGSQTDTAPLVLFAGVVTAALLFYRVLLALPSPQSVVDAKLGAVLGLLAAVGIALGGFESVRAQRRRRRQLRQRARRRPPLATESRAR